MKIPLTKKTAIIAVILLAVLLNFGIFCTAYPQTFAPQTDTLARDFSAYYMGAWRLFNNPTEVYHDGSLPGDYAIMGQPQPFKYVPSFLILFSPLLGLDFQTALNVFDIVQFLSIFALAFFVYRLVEDKNLFLAAAVALIVILQPLLFTPSISYDWTAYMQYRVASLNYMTFSPSYYCGYLLANAHILQNTLLVGAVYFAYTKKPWLSALLLAFGVFDPRTALFAFPLLLWYNRHSLVKFVGGSAVFIAATNLPFFFYNGVGFLFLQSVMHGSVVSQMYLYDWIPIFSMSALTLLEVVTLLYNKRAKVNYLKENPRHRLD